MYSYIEGQNGIKDTIALYRNIVTNNRVKAIKALRDYYINSDQKQKYILGISKIQKAIDNQQILTIATKDSGIIKIRPKNVRPEKWVLFGQLLDDSNRVIKNILVCQSDVKR